MMSGPAIALGAVLVSVLASLGSYVGGYRNGIAAEKSSRAEQSVQTLSQLIGAHQTLIEQTAAASGQLHSAMALRAQQDQNFVKDFRHALKTTSAARAGCRFDDDSVRRLLAARDRAGAAATGGSVAAMPDSAPTR